MTFTLPGPTPDTYYECHHEFIAACKPLQLTASGSPARFLLARSRSMRITPAKLSITNRAATLRKGKVVKARRRAIRMKADKGTFTIPT